MTTPTPTGTSFGTRSYMASAGPTDVASLRSRSSAVRSVPGRTPPAASSLGPRDARHLARHPSRRVDIVSNSLESHQSRANRQAVRMAESPCASSWQRMMWGAIAVSRVCEHMKRVLLRWMAANPLEHFGDMLHDSYPFLPAFNATWTKGLTERSESCSARWRLFLANLKSRVEQGITRGVVGL